MDKPQKLSLLSRVEALKPFSEDEAWFIFRIIAISEAVGWSILIIGILIRHYKLPGSTISVLIAGQIHGTIFLIYFGVLLTIYSSLRWSRAKFLLSILAGIPPYGSLIFEQWAAHRRRKHTYQIQFYNAALVVMSRNLAYN